jgi:3-methyladenine DNA glycosylase/8-oxoguanine DNA glycosylase
LIDAVPAMLGAEDDPSGFTPLHPFLVEQARRRPGLLVPKTRRVIEALVPAVLEQKVPGAETQRAWRYLMRRYGEPAPGPAPAGMRVPPDAATWRSIPSWEWHRAGVEGVRSRTILEACRVARRLEQTVDLSAAEAERKLRVITGIGVWTAAEVRQRAHGDADAVSVGDYHIPTMVGLALAGEPVDDDGMLELLAPYAGHRYRAVRLIELSGIRLPRRGPRMPVRDYRRF